MLDKYNITVNIDSDSDKNLKVEVTSPIDLYERYKLLINARNFHYDNFSKWMTYFYVAIGALFVGYYTIKGKSKEDLENFPLILSFLLALSGYMVSLLWYWSCKGYYFWNINFIMLVNHYEDTLLKFKREERVYSVFANTKTQDSYISPISGANVSTSKVAILFSFIITIIWGVIFLYEIDRCSFINKLEIQYIDQISFICALAFSIGITVSLSWLIPSKFLTSKIDHLPDLELSQDLIKTNNNNFK